MLRTSSTLGIEVGIGGVLLRLPPGPPKASVDAADGSQANSLVKPYGTMVAVPTSPMLWLSWLRSYST